MPIVKFINGRNTELSQLPRIIEYISNPEKNHKGLCAAANVSLLHTAEDMIVHKVLNNKTDGRQYVHWIISFDGNITAEKAYMIGKEALGYYSKNFQIKMSVHDNTAHVHCHFVLNTVGLNGKKFSQSQGEMLKFRDHVNSILADHGLHTVDELKSQSFEDMDKEDVTAYISSIYHTDDVCTWEEYFEEEDDDFPYYEDSNQQNGVPVLSHIPKDQWNSPETLAYGELLRLKAQEEINKINAQREFEKNGCVRPVYHEYPDEPWWR